jgi:hypothetical protein
MKTAAPASPVSVEATVAGFIVWLARQHIPFDQRQRCPDIVQRFLRWQHGQHEQGNSYSEDTYCTQMTLRGASAAQANCRRHVKTDPRAASEF